MAKQPKPRPSAKGRKAKPERPDADLVPSLIDGYRASEDRSGELDFLLPHSADPRVFDLLVRVIADPAQGVDARCKALGHISRRTVPPGPSAETQQLLSTLTDLATNPPGPGDDDGDVREWAIRALEPFAGEKAVADMLAAVLFDSAEGWEDRRAAFDALSQSAPWPERKPLFERLCSDPEMGEDAAILIRVMARYGSG